MFAERIKQIRKILGMTQKEFSIEIDIPERTVATYETGREPSMLFLARLCGKYNINANWFVTGEGEMFNAPKYEQVESDLARRMEKMEAALRGAGILAD